MASVKWEENKKEEQHLVSLKNGEQRKENMKKMKMSLLSLPEEMQVEILIKLPVNSILAYTKPAITSIDYASILTLSLAGDDKRERVIRIDHPINPFVQEDISCLQILGSSNGLICLDIWVMQDDGVQNSWIKRFTISPPGLQHQHVSYFSKEPIWSFENGEILLDATSNLAVYDPKMEKLERHSQKVISTRPGNECFM
ncbi:uncharacterized protein LOC113342498 [Papaver somniferum]|uniref:uncharacterized protein LOC113342498 n=1 Tax=Papaver somniferum TaxID=3469 RepID=UPI000E6F5F2F|nr:uncharacterized protein LOC113342498 [Papaver somniferum]